MTGALLPILSYGASAAPPGDCDLDFIAGFDGDGTGINSNGSAGTVISTSATFDALVGSDQYVILSVGVGFFLVSIGGAHAQDDFTSVTVAEWGQTFLTADATFFFNDPLWVWIWFTSTDQFVSDNDYCLTFLV